MKINVAKFGSEHGDIHLDEDLVPSTPEERAAVVLLEAGWESVSCSKDNGVRVTFSRSDND